MELLSNPTQSTFFKYDIIRFSPLFPVWLAADMLKNDIPWSCSCIGRRVRAYVTQEKEK